MKIKNIITTIMFLLLILSCSVMFALNPDSESFKKENREAAKLPQISKKDIYSGKFTSDFEKFVDDRISFRSDIMEISSFLNSSKGITPPDGKIIYAQKDIGTKTVKKASLLMLNHKVMEVFAADAEAEKLYADSINRIAEAVTDEMNVYSMLVPTQLEFTEPMYRNIQSSQKKTIEDINKNLSERIKTIDAYSALESHSDEYIYFGTDHHWTMLGAYYGYSAFMKAQGTAPVNRQSFKKNTISNFYGPLSTELDKADAEQLKPDTIEWWDTQEPNEITTHMFSYADGEAKEYHASPLLDETKKDYSVFLTADHPLAVIENDNLLNNKTLLIVKDSYANDFAPWLVNNYHTVILLDPRGFKGKINDVISQYKADDLLIMNYIFTPTFEDYSELLWDLA